MSPKLPLLTPQEIIKALQKIGFEFVSQRGSHLKMQAEPDPKKTVIIPMHSIVARGTLRSILKQAEIDAESFLELLE